MPSTDQSSSVRRNNNLQLRRRPNATGRIWTFTRIFHGFHTTFGERLTAARNPRSGVIREAIAPERLGRATITPAGEFKAGSYASSTATYTAGACVS